MSTTTDFWSFFVTFGVLVFSSSFVWSADIGIVNYNRLSATIMCSPNAMRLAATGSLRAWSDKGEDKIYLRRFTQ
jgi:hypothetical protein